MTEPIRLPITLRNFFLQTYCLKPRVAGGSERTVATYLADVANLENYFREKLQEAGQPPRDVTLDDLSDDLITEAMAWLIKRGRTKATANRLRRNLCAIWRYARKKKRVQTQPEDVEEYQEPKVEPVCWTFEEICLILEAAAEERGWVGDAPANLWWVALVYFAYNTGVRISAIMGTPTANLDLAGRQVLIPWAEQKQAADQLLDLMEPTAEALARLHPQRHTRIFDDWPYDRTQRQWPALNARLRGILTRAGLPTGRKDLWHKFRRTTLTYVTANSDEQTAQAIAGHSSIHVTRRYLDRRMQKKHPSVAELLPQPQVGPQLRLFSPPEADAAG